MATDAAALIQEVADSGLFDAAWYRAGNPDVAAAELDPLTHFACFGMEEGRAPNRYFDPAWYRRQNPDVVETDLDPFLHYLRHGDLEGRQPHPFVDPGWYRDACALAADQPALRHFLTHSEDGLHAPGPELVAVTLMADWRGPHAVDRYLDSLDGAPVSPDPAIVAGSDLLDPNHYLINASDVQEAGANPVDHYCRFGWREQRQPNVYFDTAWYVATNPDLGRRRMNPLVHYVLVGEPTGRRPVSYFDPTWYRATYDVPAGKTALAHFLAHRRQQTVSPNSLFDVAWYVARNRDSLGANRDPFAHYLQVGTVSDVDPSPGFDAKAYRRRHLGRPSRVFVRVMDPDRHNPLVHFLRSHYR
jgi:hypothetical protein